MILPLPNIAHITSARHEGKLVILAVDNAGRVFYTVRRDGFEQTPEKPLAFEDWENPQQIVFPGGGVLEDDTEDASVIEKQRQDFLVHKPDAGATEPDWATAQRGPQAAGDAFILRSRYSTHTETSAAPIQALSALGHLYLFRRSKDNATKVQPRTLLVDRFVLDGLTNRLVRKVEVRFKRSRERYRPLEPRPGDTQPVFDTPDFRDTNNFEFLEPTTELSLVNRMENEAPCVALVPTDRPEIFRWHFFKRTTAGTVEAISIRASSDGLFDASDIVGEAGIERRTISFAVKNGAVSQAAAVTGGPTAAKYDEQVERASADGTKRLLRTATRLMLTAPTANGMTCLSFRVAANGTLTPLNEIKANSTQLNGTSRTAPLAPNTLDQIRPITTAPAEGTIRSLERGEAGKIRVTLDRDPSAAFPAGSRIELTGTQDYDGQYIARAIVVGQLAAVPANNTLRLASALAEPVASGAKLRIRSRVPGVVAGSTRDEIVDVSVRTAADAGAQTIAVDPFNGSTAVGAAITHLDLFDIEAPFAGSQLGRWREVATDPVSQTFQGAITGIVQAGSGRVHIQSPGHGLSDGSEIRIRRTESLDGTYTITQKTLPAATLDAIWEPGEVVRVSAGARGGLHFETAGDFITIPNGGQYDLAGAFTVEAWVRTTQDGTILSRTSLDGAGGDEGVTFFIASGRLALGVGGAGIGGNFVGTAVLTDGAFHHVAAAYTRGSASFFVDGQPDPVSGLPGPFNGVAVPVSRDGVLTIASTHRPEGSGARRFTGTLYDLRLWDRVRTQQEIASTRALPLIGREQGLVGNWRLDGVLEDVRSTAADFTPRANHGIVSGDPFASEVELKRRANAVDVRAFENPDVVTLAEGASYEESFEFEMTPATFDAAGSQAPFRFAYTGRRSRDSRDVLTTAKFNVDGESITRVPNSNRFRAKCRFTVPEGGSQVRSFGLDRVSGNWESMRIRRHRIREVSGVSESFRAESAEINALVSNYDTLVTQLRKATGLELLAIELERQIALTSAAVREGTAGERSAELRQLEAKRRGLIGDIASPLNYWCRIRATFTGDNGAPAELYTPPERTTPALLRSALSDAGADSTMRVVEISNEAGVRLVEIQSAAQASLEQVGVVAGVSIGEPGVAQILKDIFGETGNRRDRRPHLCLDLVNGEVTWRASVSELRAALIAENVTPQQMASLNVSSPRQSQAWRIQAGAVEEGLVDSFDNIDRAHAFSTVARINPASSPRFVVFQLDEQSRIHPDDVKGHFVLRDTEFSDVFVFERPAHQAVNPGDPPAKGEVRDSATVSVLDAKEAELRGVLQQIRALHTQVSTNDGRLKAALTRTRTELAATAAAVRQSVAAIGGTVPLPALGSARTPRGWGGLLSFVRPGARRVEMSENTDGNVALTYIEDGSEIGTVENAADTIRATVADALTQARPVMNERRLRRVAFDVTKQAWNFDLIQRCRTLEATDSRLEVPQSPDAVTLAESWTFECWFYTPFPLVGQTLTRAVENDPHVIVEFSDGMSIGVRRERLGLLPAGSNAELTTTGIDLHDIEPGWHHLTATGGGGNVILMLDGGSRTHTAPRAAAAVNLKTIGNRAAGAAPCGRIAQVRVWDLALTKDEAEANAMIAATGREPRLQAFYPLEADTEDHAGSNPALTAVNVTEQVFTSAGAAFSLGVVNEVTTAEYTTFTTQPAGAMMRSALAVPDAAGIRMFAQKRIELLELRWIGNGQFEPTLLGYIEGAPPVPSENMTVALDGYQGATSVTLAQTRDLELAWNRSRETSTGGALEFFAGASGELESGAFGLVSTKVLEFKVGAVVAGSLSAVSGATSDISASSGTVFTDRLELRGHVEAEAQFEILGRRFQPKNVGYAVVVSSLADVFVARLVRSQRMVGYQVLPVPGVPPDVNTITFQINPAYTLNGTLDGMVGSEAADDRFYRHVPDLRSRFGSSFPASYFRLREAVDLKRRIEEADKRREAYFQNFDLAVNELVGIAVDAVESITGIDVTQRKNPDESETRDVQKKVDAAGQQKKDEIATRFANDPDKRTHASAAFATWQRRMEDLRIQAGKRNIVNTYVWDADGGLRSESQSFASTVEHTLASQINLEGSLGFKAEIEVGGFAADLDARVTMSLTETLSKTARQSEALSVEVNLDGVESLGVTDNNDQPILPGEKVDRYRFMTFYLEPHADHFSDFFNEVVDPEWLASNSEEARALRQARAGKPNKVWRLLHRVTAVERPALRDFGRDARPASAASAAEPSLEEQVKALAGRLDEVLALLRARAVGAGG